MYTNCFDIAMYDDDGDAVHENNRFYELHGQNRMITCLAGANLSMPVDPIHDFHRLTSENSTSEKQLIFKTDPEEEPETWRVKAKSDWTENDVLHWIADEASRGNFPCEAVNASEFKVDGATLLRFSREDFFVRDPLYGEYLYNALHRAGLPDGSFKTESHMLATGYTTLQPSSSSFEETDLYCDGSSENKEYKSEEQVLSEDKDSESDSEPKPVAKPAKRPPGRPPGTKTKEKAKKTGRLWEFIRDLLHNKQYCPSVICWEDHSLGVFRFVKSEKVAKIWGSRKGNDKMNYEKLSRAMRYYYKSKVLQPVLGRKLVYKFGPTARGWQSENPNFRN